MQPGRKFPTLYNKNAITIHTSTPMNRELDTPDVATTDAGVCPRYSLEKEEDN